MDPVTAAFQSFTEFSKLLQTTQGQLWMAINNQLVTDILTKLNVHIAPGAPTPAPAA